MRLKNKSGFTLIEILVALAIFSFIAIGTATAVTRSLKVKRMIESQWQSVHAIRTAIMVMNRDIYLAFHKLSAARPFGFGASDRDKWFRSYFKGKLNTIQFSSLSNRRLYASTHESELAEVEYKLTSDAEILDRQNLSRRTTPFIDDNPEEGGKFLVLLESVKDLKFRYFDKANDRWSEDWDSSHSDFRNRFPDAVEVTITLLKNKKELNYTTKIILGAPNNVKAQGSRPGRPRPPGTPGQGGRP